MFYLDTVTLTTKNKAIYRLYLSEFLNTQRNRLNATYNRYMQAGHGRDQGQTIHSLSIHFTKLTKPKKTRIIRLLNQFNQLKVNRLDLALDVRKLSVKDAVKTTQPLLKGIFRLNNTIKTDGINTYFNNAVNTQSKPMSTKTLLIYHKETKHGIGYTRLEFRLQSRPVVKTLLDKLEPQIKPLANEFSHLINQLEHNQDQVLDKFLGFFTKTPSILIARFAKLKANLSDKIIRITPIICQFKPNLALVEIKTSLVIIYYTKKTQRKSTAPPAPPPNTKPPPYYPCLNLIEIRPINPNLYSKLKIKNYDYT